ncbi:MAG: PKD domain-containing protein, partial [Thermoanaerobaculia bacterium]|nr:PKD domain-containing protein [Thermoanaerobaculia bacterium]
DCSGRDTIWVKIRAPFGMTGPLELCADAKGALNAKFHNSSQSLNCLWTLYAPNGSPVWTSPAASFSASPAFTAGAGTYRVRAVPSAADWSKTCSDSADWKVLVHPKPAAPDGIAGSPVFCPGQPLTFKATGVSGQNNIRWSVKNSAAPASIKEGNPIVVEFTAGTPRWVSAQQVSANSLGCASDTVLYEVKELSAPAISGNTQLCAGDLKTFTAPEYPDLKYEWSLFPTDAGAIKTGQGMHEVEVFWPHPGVFELRLTVCGKQSTQVVVVNAPPEPQPVYPPGVCAGETAQALASDGQLYNAYLWKNESGNTVGTGFDAQLGPGKYALVVTDANGCRGTAEMTIDEYPLPNLTISTVDPTGFCNNSRTVTMSALTTEDGDFQYEWYRDNVPLGIDAPVYTTNQYGYYKASVTNQYGCKASDGPIHVFEYCGGVCHNPNHSPVCPPGSVDFTATTTAECNRVQFNLIAGPDYKPGSAFWHFGESGSSFLGSSGADNPEFTFPNASQYIVVLYAYLQNGAKCIVLDSVFVPAAAQFGQAPGCPGDSTFLKDVSTFLPQTQITKWVWDFDEPSSGAANNSTSRDVKHGYTNAGNYDVTLTVTAASGCTSSYTRPVKVPALPTLTPIPQTALCAGNGVPMALAETPDLTDIKWDLGDPASGALNTASGASVVHKYETPGNYTATVTVTNVAGCQNTITQNVNITPNTLAGAISPAGKSVICEGASLGLSVSATGTDYKWSNGASGPSIQVSEAGVYNVTISDAMGCTYVPPAKTVEVNPAPGGEVKAILIDDNGQSAGIVQGSLITCQGENVLLFADADGAYTYQWPGNGLGSTQYFTKDRNNLLSVGTHTYVVTLTNAATGCTATTAPFTVAVNPVPGGFSAAADQQCAGTPATVAYNGPQPPGYQYFWNNGEVGPSFVTKEPGHYFVRVVNQFGCAANSEKVTIRPGPNIGAVPSGCHRRCAPDSLCLPPMPDIVSWQWYFNGAPIPGASGPTIVAEESGVYWAHLVDTSGCNAQTVPLTLELYTGTGNVSGQVWSDVNNNGVIDPADTLVSGIPVNLWQNGILNASLNSGAGGDFVFSNVPSVNGFVAVDSAALPSHWEIVIGQSNANLVGCKANAQTGLLLHRKTCLGSTGTLQVSACDGTVYDYHGTKIPAGSSQQFLLQNAAGCDSVLTVNVATLPVSSGILSVSACAGTEYDYHGTKIPAGSSQQFILQNAAGCDSVL